MARVEQKLRNSGGKHTYTCTGCGKPVTAGERYYTWARRRGRMGSRYYRHVACGYPRPTQLSDAKTAQVDEAVQDAGQMIDGWVPELAWEEVTPGSTLEIDYSDLTQALEDAAACATDVGQEYSGNADNMPDSLQYGSQAEAMRAVGDELEQWAGNLEGWQPTCDSSIEVPADYSGTDADKEALQAAWDEAVEAMQQDAHDALEAEGVPEYQG